MILRSIPIGMDWARGPAAAASALFGLRGMSIEHVDVSGLVSVRRRYLGFEATLIARHLVLKLMGHSGPDQIKILNEVVAPAGLDLIWPVSVSGGILLPERMYTKGPGSQPGLVGGGDRTAPGGPARVRISASTSCSDGTPAGPSRGRPTRRPDVVNKRFQSTIVRAKVSPIRFTVSGMRTRRSCSKQGCTPR